MMRKLLAALTAYLMLNIVLACAAGAADFGDVPDDYWAREEIQYVTDRGLFLGMSAESFAPDSGMTRGQMAMVLYRLAGLPETDAEMPYTDVRAGAYYYDAVRWAVKNGIFTEVKLASRVLAPDEGITRGEFAVMLRSYDLTQGGEEPENVAEGIFTDMENADPEVRSAVLGWAYPMGILRGTAPTTMNPNGRLTRAHVAAMLCRYDRMGNRTSALPFRVAPPHTAEELASGKLEPNETYTLLVGEAYAEHYYAVTSNNPNAVEVTYQEQAWQLHTKADGAAVLTITDKKTGREQTLYVTVGSSGVANAPSAEKEKALDDYRAERLEIIRLANEVRVRNGVNKCVVSEALMDAAQKFAETMPLDHDIPLEYQIRAESGCNHGAGCNLYRATNVKLSAMPLSAVYAWEHSRGHYTAMVNGGSDSMGIGLYHDETENTWYTVMFIGDCQKAGSILGNSHP